MAALAVNAFCDWCSIVLVQQDGTLVHAAAAHRDERRFESLQALLEAPLVADSLPVRVIASGDPILNAELHGEENISHLETQTLNALGTHSAMILPLIARGTTIGAMTLVSRKARLHSEQRNLQAAETFALRAALQIENARLFERESQASRELTFLSELGEILVRSLDLQVTLKSITRLLVPEFADWALISLLDDAGDLRPAALLHDEPAKAARVWTDLSSDENDLHASLGSAAAIRTGEPQIYSHVDHDTPDTSAQRSNYPEAAPPALKQLGYHSSVTIPMTTRGRVVGLIVATWTTPERTYTEKNIPLFREVARRAVLAIQNAQSFEREQHVATSLQQAFLPPSLPQLAGLQFDALYEPGARELEIGGDWYDAFALADGRAIVAIGDVSGHGLEAAVVMAKAREMVRVLGVQGLAPDAILNMTNSTLKMDQRSVLVTAMVAIIDIDRRRILYASAGHPPALLLEPSGTILELARTGVPLGVPIETGPIMAESVAVPDGSLLVMYTDGLTEATRDPLYGSGQLTAALLAPSTRATAKPARAIYNRVLAQHSRDDVAILTVRFK